MKAILLLAFLICNVFTYLVPSTLPGCNSTDQQQSPININTTLSKYYEERYFRVISTNYTEIDEEHEWKVTDNTIGFEGNFGTVILVRNWAMYRFNLTKVLFRVGGGHTINGQKPGVEMEFVHTLDKDYVTPGRYIHPTAETFVASIFFLPNSSSEKTSRLFEFLNIDELGTKLTKPLRPIKINRLIQHQGSLLYDGTIDSTSQCRAAWRLIMPSYQVIPTEHQTVLEKIMKVRNISSVREINSVTPKANILRNTETTEMLTFQPHTIQYDATKGIFVSAIIIVVTIAMLFF